MKLIDELIYSILGTIQYSVLLGSYERGGGGRLAFGREGEGEFTQNFHMITMIVIKDSLKLSFNYGI